MFIQYFGQNPTKTQQKLICNTYLLKYQRGNTEQKELPAAQESLSTYHVRETYRMFETRKKEHEKEILLNKKDIVDGNIK